MPARLACHRHFPTGGFRGGLHRHPVFCATGQHVGGHLGQPANEEYLAQSKRKKETFYSPAEQADGKFGCKETVDRFHMLTLLSGRYMKDLQSRLLSPMVALDRSLTAAIVLGLTTLGPVRFRLGGRLLQDSATPAASSKRFLWRQHGLGAGL